MPEPTSNTVKAKDSSSPKPSFLKRLWEGWKRIGLFIGKVNLYVLTFIVYWTVFLVTALIAKMLRRDFLSIRMGKDQENTFWKPLPEADTSIEKHQRQF